MILNLLDDIFNHELLQYLTLYDIAIFDTAITNHIYRPQFLNKISEVTLKDNINIYKFNIKLLYKWLIIRKIKNIFKFVNYKIEQIIQMPKDKIIPIIQIIKVSSDINPGSSCGIPVLEDEELYKKCKKESLKFHYWTVASFKNFTEYKNNINSIAIDTNFSKFYINPYVNA